MSEAIRGSWSGAYLVERGKLLDYLLDPNHERGGAKARFFLGQGFGPADPERLAGALIALASGAIPTRAIEDEHGLKFVHEGFIETPSGKRPFVRTIWRVSRTEPRDAYLTTAYPRTPPIG